MKELRITFDDKDYRQLKKVKKTTPYNWRDFIIALAHVHQEKLDELLAIDQLEQEVKDGRE
jgi:predicted CopG family antitoxin